MGQRRQRHQQGALVETNDKLADADIEQNKRGTSLIRGVDLRGCVPCGGGAGAVEMVCLILITAARKKKERASLVSPLSLMIDRRKVKLKQSRR
jgi:hypothetical protein